MWGGCLPALRKVADRSLSQLSAPIVRNLSVLRNYPSHTATKLERLIRKIKRVDYESEAFKWANVEGSRASGDRGKNITVN